MKNNPPLVPNKKLILHFDVSTIKLPSNIDKDLYIYELCSSWVWGKLEKTSKQDPDKVTGWKIALNTLSVELPQPELISYKQYLEQFVKPSREQYEKLILNMVKGPASKAKGEIQKNIKNITLPKTLAESLKQGADPSDKLLQYYNKTGKYQILPSFFKLLLTLKKLKRQFAVIIKGNLKQNHEQIVSQLNRFFGGEHPLYNGKNGTPLVKWDGSKGTHLYQIQGLNETVLYQITDQYFATYGTRNHFQQNDPQMFKQKFKSFKNVKLCQGLQQIYAVGHATLSQSACIYQINPFNMLVLDPVDYLTHEIYFTNDQNVKIYSCLGTQIEEKRNFVNKVLAFQFFKDIDYFIKYVELLQNQRALQIQKIQNGQVKQEEQEQIKNKDIQLSNYEYLKRNLLPVLEGALKQVDLHRPQDPIAYIAMYCLKNKDRLQ